MSNALKILVIYPYYAVYREQLFRMLDDCVEFEIEYMFGDVTLDRLPRADPSLLSNATNLSNVWFGHSFPKGPYLWQRGSLRAALQTHAQVILFAGDWHHLSTWAAAAVARVRKRATVFHTMGWRGSVGRGERVLKRAFYSLANYLFLYGDKARLYALDQGYSANRLHVVYNSGGALPDGGRRLSVESRQALLSDLGLKQGQPTLICVSRIEPKRKVDLAIHAASRLAAAGRPVNILLVGEYTKDAGAELRRLANQLNVSLSMPGAVYDDKKLRLFYELSTCAVIPGAAGLAVTQALSHGVPVVTSDNWDIQGPEVEALEHGRSGYFYDYDNIASLTEAVQNCIELADIDGTSEQCVQAIQDRYTPCAQASAFGAGFKAAARRDPE